MSRFIWHIATIGGIPIYIHWSFWLLILWVILGAVFSPQASWGFVIWRLLVITGLVISVILHELGHSFAAKIFHIPTRDITMYPFGGVASLARIPDKPIQELVVAIAGPLVNFLLIGVFMSVLFFLGAPMEWSAEALMYPETALPPITAWLMTLAVMNAVLAIFNLLPAFPMDGGRVLRAILATRLPYLRATRIAAMIGQGFAVLFILLGIFGNPFLILIGFFVFVAAAQERSHVEQRASMQPFPIEAALLRRVPTLTIHQKLDDAIHLLLDSQARSFLIVDSFGHPVGSLSREQIIEALSEGKSRLTPLSEIMDTQLLIVPPALPLHEGFQLLNEQHKPFLVVMQDRHLLGIVDAENIAEFLLIRQAESQAS